MSCKAKIVISNTKEQHMAKRLKMDVEDHHELTTTVRSDTTLLHLNDDCLEEIFSHFNISDSLNIIETNSRFLIPTKIAFARKFHKVPVTVSNVLNPTLKMSLNILRQFGHSITKLCIHFKLEKIERLIEAIVEYCGGAIIELNFSHEEESMLYGNGLQKMKHFLRQMNIKFPNLKHLRFEYDNCGLHCPYTDDIIQAIPTLTSFSVEKRIFSPKHLVKFFDLNVQLESVTLNYFYLTQNLLDNLDASLTRLKHLDLHRSCVSVPNVESDSSIRFKNLKTLHLCTCNHLRNFCIRGEEIQKLELYIYDSVVISNILESIGQFKKLTSLTLHGWMDLLDSSGWFLNVIHEVILRNNQLKKISIIWFNVWHNDPKDYKYLECYDFIKNKLNGAHWNVEVDSKGISFSKEINVF